VKATARRPDAFDALADPTRRAIITMLRDGAPQTAGAIAGAFPRISRPAVSKHLRILRESRLVHAAQSGREWRYTLDAAELSRMQRDWFEQFAPLMDEALVRLKKQAERQPALG
jgi:DNA-binding transcriptional ArsR family regulator